MCCAYKIHTKFQRLNSEGKKVKVSHFIIFCLDYIAKCWNDTILDILGKKTCISYIKFAHFFKLFYNANTRKFQMTQMAPFYGSHPFLENGAFLKHCFPSNPSQHLIGLEVSFILGVPIGKLWKEKISPRSVCSHGKLTYIHGGRRLFPVASSLDFTSTTIDSWLLQFCLNFPSPGVNNYKEGLIFSTNTYW